MGVNMAEKDKVQKTLESYNDVFADIVNVLLFDGRQVVDEKDLTDAQTFSYYKMDGKTVRGQDRDVAKIWNNGEIRISFIGLENQMQPDKFMPLRVIGYDGAAYRNQLNENLKDKCYPVITLVLYFGTKRRWKKYKSLKEIMNIPKGLDAYITDYKINIFELAWLTDEQIYSFTSDFRYVAILLRRLRTGRPYPMTDTKYKHAREIIDLFRVMSQNNKEIGIILDDIKNERNHTGGAHMTVEEMDEMINRFENRGAQKQAVEAAKNLYTNGVSIDVISKSLNMTPEQVKEIVKDVVVLQA
jgi:hypothetical protein